MAAPALVTYEDAFEEFLAFENAKDLLRFTTAGSVDDGKSTLIGRLLYDSRNVYEDQLESVTKASLGGNAGPIDFSLLTDGLRAEREQGITIDVAHRYFSTARRKFIIADTPGHEQYTRNMVTGASNADLAIVLVDARKGLLPQSRRHAFIAALLGLRHLVVAVNKMDLVAYDEGVFRRIEQDFRAFLREFPSIQPYFIPISALCGDNVVARSGNTPWFHGASLLEYLEQAPVGNRARAEAFRFPVQRVVRPNRDFRGYAGTVASGHVRIGDEITAFPSGKQTRVAAITTFNGNLKEAHAGEAITLTLSDELDITRGDLFASTADPLSKCPATHCAIAWQGCRSCFGVSTKHRLAAGLPATASSIRATLIWLNEAPADINRRYRLKHMSRQEWAELKQIDYRININTLAQEPASTLEMNAIGVVRLEAGRPLTFDPYAQNRTTGSFVLMDPVTNATVAAGLIQSGAHTHAGRLETRLDARMSWRLEDGALVISPTANSDKSSPISDETALKALEVLFERLSITW